MNIVRIVCIVFTLVHFNGCGLFTPREITVVPQVESDTPDPFLFGILLDGTGETFPRVAWQDFFHSNCQYSNVNFASITYGKNLLVNHLQQELQLHPAIKVSWEKTENFSRDADRITLNNVHYTVLDSAVSVPVIGAGSCDFEIRRDTPGSPWQIRLWKDLPQQSFFSP